MNGPTSSDPKDSYNQTNTVLFMLKRSPRSILNDCCFTGNSGWAGEDYPSSARRLPRVCALHEKEAGRRVLVEEPGDKYTEEDMQQTGWGEKCEEHTAVAISFPFFQILEGGEVSYAGEGKESGIPWENSPAKPVMGLNHVAAMPEIMSTGLFCPAHFWSSFFWFIKCTFGIASIFLGEMVHFLEISKGAMTVH